MKIELIIVIGIIILAVIIMNYPQKSLVSINDAKFIGENSILFVQEGCIHCENQLKDFGENQKYLNIIDCTKNYDYCLDISATPTWRIAGEYYSGYRTSSKLKEIIGNSFLGTSEPYKQGVVNNEQQAELIGKNIGDTY